MEIAGPVDYPDGKKLKTAEAFKETIQYVKSTPIIGDVDHTKYEKYTLDDVVGYTDNYKVKGDRWSANYHWNMDKITDNKLKRAILSGENIPGSTWGFVKTIGDKHTAQVPIHMLVHPDLKPRIAGAGVVANAIQFSEEPEMDEELKIKYKEEIKTLKSDLKASVAANAILTTNKEALTVKLGAYKSVLVADIVANSSFTEAEIKDKEFEEIELIQNTLAKEKREGVDPIILGNSTDLEKGPKTLADRIKETMK